MILRQFLHSSPVEASYLFGCGGRAAAAVVDPIGDIAPYLRAAEESGMHIRYVIDTHLHADHVSAGRELAESAGAEYVLFAEAKVAFPFHGVRDGDVLEVGNVAIRVLHTRGHTPEHISPAYAAPGPLYEGRSAFALVPTVPTAIREVRVSCQTIRAKLSRASATGIRRAEDEPITMTARFPAAKRRQQRR
jgi:glyoxylase-like metal-dependent hydrolase (beta-lactamase superfamily II)